MKFKLDPLAPNGISAVTTIINASSSSSGETQAAVTLAGEDYLSLSGQQITANPIDLDNLSATGTPDASTFLRGDNTWATPAGAGDMDASTYDPQNIADDAFDTDNHTNGTTNKVFTAVEKTKLAGIEALADVTDATNVDAAGATMNADTTLAGNGYFLDEDNMASNSATKVPSQQSVKAYVDAVDTGTVDSVVAGNNIDVDASDPANPVVSVETLSLADISDVTASATEVNYTDGVTSAIQTQLDGKQPLDSDLTTIAGLSPSNDDVIQRKAGAWANRTMAQVKTDLSLTKSDVGLGNVDNTSDASKPVSTATQTALDLKANLASPTFTGTPAAPTAAAATNTTQIATTAHVFAERANSATLTNKTIDGDDNTITDLGTTSLKDGAVTAIKMATPPSRFVAVSPGVVVVNGVDPANTNWTAVDITANTSATAYAAVLQIGLASGTTAFRAGYVRRTGDSDAQDIPTLAVQNQVVSSSRTWNEVTVLLSSGQSFDWSVNNADVSNFTAVLRGYYELVA